MSNIAVIGDATIDLLKVEKEKSRLKGPNNGEHDFELYEGFDFVEINGGVFLLAEMIEKSGKINEEDAIFTYGEEDIKKKSRSFIHTIATLKVYNSSVDDNCPEDGKTNRVNYFDGLRFNEDKDNIEKFKMRLKKRTVKKDFLNYNRWQTAHIGTKQADEEELQNADIILIHDHGNYFRNIPEKDLKTQILDKVKNEVLFIYKMRFPLAEGKLWEKVAKFTDEDEEKNLIVIISADDLRKNGLRISRSLSWERTAYDLQRNIKTILKEKPKDEKLKKLYNLFELKNISLIIRFETDGAILYQPDKKEDEQFTLFFDPDVFEGSIDHKYPGNMKGLGISFVSGLVLGIKDSSELDDNQIRDGIKKGIIISRNLYEYGFKLNNENKLNYPFKDMFSIKETEIEKIIDINIKDQKKWKIMEQKLKGEDRIYDAACQFVKSKEKSVLESPVAEFGSLRTADRSEIESYHSIKNLIEEYLKKNTNIPLSIAVFGPPGSGKSFGVTQIAKSISKDIKKLEFNLSQFESPQDLFSAFHMIQSTSLEGKTPMVFFDEFDCNLEGTDYGWLRYFLSPMNDGKFKQGDTIHPIGKSIFVFAGGTSANFADFNPGKKVKGSDFKSRLRGFVNIIGINSSKNNMDGWNDWLFESGNYNEDNLYMIRRAITLRTMLEETAENIFDKDNKGNKTTAHIDKSVLNAFIKVPEYIHGVRSMKAIIEMSILSNKKRFERSALPSAEQLGLHVDMDEFKKYLNE